jgi:hypothetical protein
MASSYVVTVDAEGRKTPLLSYTGTIDDVNGLRVERDGGTARLVYGPDGAGAPLVLDEAKDPGGPLELTRQRQEKGAKAVTRAVE